MKTKNLEEAFLVKIQALYDIETQLVKALPKMAKKASNEELRNALVDHLEETKEHVARLEEVFKAKDLKPKKVKVEAIRGLIADAEWTMSNSGSDEVRDASIIAAAQYVEHYEIAGYGAAVEWAKVLGDQDAEELLSVTLEEEKTADEKLSMLAATGINEAAADLQTE